MTDKSLVVRQTNEVVMRQNANREAIDHFKYEFISDDDGNLKCIFCKEIFIRFDIDFLTNHTCQTSHNINRIAHYLKEKSKKGLFKTKFKVNDFNVIAADVLKLESDSMMRIEAMEQKEFEEYIVSKLPFPQTKLITGKLEKVKIALNSKMFRDSYFNKVICNHCDSEINDSLTDIAAHIENCIPNFQSLVPVIDWKVEESIVNKVNREKHLRILPANNKLLCIACKDEIICNSFSISRHLESQHHADCVKVHENRIFIDNTILSSEFTNWLTLTLSSSNTSFSTIKSLYDFFENFTGRKIPCETTLRKHLFQSYNFVKNRVRKEIGENMIFISMDEASAAKFKFVSVIIGTLNPTNPCLQKQFVFDFVKLTTAWTTSEVIKIFETTLNELYGNNWKEIAQKKVKLFVSDAGSQMVSGGKKLQKEYPSMLFLTCICHGLHNLCATILSLFPNAMKFVTAMNNLLYRSTARMSSFLTLLNIKKKPVKAVETRWGTGLDACDYWCSNFDFAVSFLSTLKFTKSRSRSQSNEKDDVTHIELAKQLILLDSTKEELEFCSKHYSFISKVIHSLEKRNQSIETSIGLVESVKQGLLKQIDNAIGKVIFERFIQILDKNPGFNSLVSNIANNPDFEFLKFAPIGSYEAERANKVYKSTATSDRAGMTGDNIKMKAYLRFNSISLGMRDVKVRNAQDKNPLQTNTLQKLSFSSLFIQPSLLPIEPLTLESEHFSLEEFDEELNSQLDDFEDDDDDFYTN